MGKKNLELKRDKEKDIAKPQVDLDFKDFSDLPEDILHRIISFLPSFESSVGIIFFPKWKDVCKKVFIQHQTTLEEMDIILKFLINFKLHSPTNKWEFKFNFGPNRVLNVATAAHTITFHLDFPVSEEEISNLESSIVEKEFSHRWWLPLPRSCSALQHNVLSNHTLYLISVNLLCSELITSMVPNFMFIKNLIIAKCNGIKTLSIEDFVGLEKLVVLDCPELEQIFFLKKYGDPFSSFQYRGRLIIFQFRNIKRSYMEDAMLDYREGPPKEWRWKYGYFQIEQDCGCVNNFKCFKWFMEQGINGVKSLTLCKWFFEEFMCKKLFDLEFCFERLRELWWIDCSMERENINALLCFMKLCPKLEKLYVTIDPKSYKSPNTGKSSSIFTAVDKLKSLELVKLEGCTDEKAEISLARRLIPLFLRSPVIISKPDRTRLRQLNKVYNLQKEWKFSYKFVAVEKLQDEYPDHVHMKV